MRFSADAGKLASALSLVAALAVDKIVKKIPILGAVRMTAIDRAIAVSLCNGDAHLTLSIAAEITEPGEIAASAERLAALIAGFPSDATVTIASDGAVVVISSGRSRFKLPVHPLTELPALTLVDEISPGVVVTRDDAIELFTRPVFALSKEETRYYLAGLFIHNVGDDLCSVATDDKRLARATITGGAGGLSADRTCIVPTPAVKAIGKLFAAHRDAAEIVLRRSRTLLDIAAAGCFTLTTKLIDAQYPIYERVIGANDGGNAVVVDRSELASAIARISAVAGDQAFVGLSWPESDGALRLTALAHHDAAYDVVVPLATSGTALTAFRADYGGAALDAFAGSDTVVIDAGAAPGAPVWITSGDGNDNLLVVQMPWRS